MKKYCQNCYHPLPYKARFCPRCGQKTTDGKIHVTDVLQQLWFRVLHLESRSWRVLWRLFIPGQVSIDYFKGKRKRYPPPVQFFFVIMFFFLLMLNHLVGDNGRLQFKKSEAGIHVSSNDTIIPPGELYEIGVRYARMQRLRSELDSLPPDYQTPLVRAALDSVIRRTSDDKVSKFIIDSLFKRTQDSLTFSLGFRTINVSVMDMFELSPESVIKKYNITHWADKVLIRQGSKSVKEPKALLKSYMKSLGWTLLVLVALMSGTLTLLYWRRKRYYVEHFIFLLHLHSGIFLLLTATLFLNQFLRFPVVFWGFLIAWLVFMPLIAMYRYYGQGWFKTVIKWLLFMAVYMAGFAVLFISGMVLIFLIF